MDNSDRLARLRESKLQKDWLELRRISPCRDQELNPDLVLFLLFSKIRAPLPERCSHYSLVSSIFSPSQYFPTNS